jgi:uncharacterized protein YndB with AHSA1/START domain
MRIWTNSWRNCHTKRELLDQWFAPKGLKTETKYMNFKVGGYWHYAMIAPDGQSFWNRLDYQAISPIDSYSALDGFCDASGAVNADMPRAHWNVSFVEVGDHTVVTTAVLYDSEHDVQKVIDMGLKDGMASTLDRLDELLEKLSSS